MNPTNPNPEPLNSDKNKPQLNLSSLSREDKAKLLNDTPIQNVPEQIYPGYPEERMDNKKPKSRIILILALVILVSFSVAAYFLILNSSQKSSKTNKRDPLISKEVSIPDSISEAQMAFGVDLIKQLESTKKNPSDSTFISPTSISLAMSMANLGAKDKTKQEISKVLKSEKNSDQDLQKANNAQLKLFQKNDEKIKISIANSFWADKADSTNNNFKVKSTFNDNLKKFYLSEANILDLQDPKSRDVINNWVKENTQEKIPTIIDDPVPKDARFYLINAVYFKGTWKFEFNKDNTYDDQFTDSSGTAIIVPFMSLSEELNYYSSADIQVVQLPYGENNEFAMDIFLPKEMSKFMNDMSADSLASMQSEMKKKEGTVELPRFKMDYTKKLNDPLKNLGIKSAFMDDADFSDISDTSLKIDSVMHKTFLEVNEEGTEAAAVTSIGGAQITSAGEPDDNFFVKLDKPFFIIIKDTETNSPLFMGAINSIEN